MKFETKDIFEKLCGQMTSLYDELSILSKKSPNDAVNKFKLKFINKLLQDSNTFLSEKYWPFEDFQEFDEDDIPQNGDVVFILSQYLQCFEKFRSDNVVLRNGAWCWSIDDDKAEGGKSYIRTVKPARLKE